jgi:hypothetical protein
LNNVGGRFVRDGLLLEAILEERPVASGRADERKGMSMDPTVWVIPIDLATWVKEREEQLIAEENATFETARAGAATDEERRFWDEFIATRTVNMKMRSA